MLQVKFQCMDLARELNSLTNKFHIIMNISLVNFVGILVSI